jgi:small subunit ribosomal protein S4
MARYIGPTCKLARREGVDLELKSPSRGLESKCKLNQPRGNMALRAERALFGYATQLREKQKVRRSTAFWKQFAIIIVLRPRKALPAKT